MVKPADYTRPPAVPVPVTGRGTPGCYQAHALWKAEPEVRWWFVVDSYCE